MGFRAQKSAALSCIAFSYAAQIQPTRTRTPSSFSYDHIYQVKWFPHQVISATHHKINPYYFQNIKLIVTDK